MPYIHKGCGGVIPLRPPIKCRKCGTRWNWRVLFAPTPPKNMVFAVIKPRIGRKGETQYARWADKILGAGVVASRLPNWPRWARILAVCCMIVGTVFLVRYFLGL